MLEDVFIAVMYLHPFPALQAYKPIAMPIEVLPVRGTDYNLQLEP